MNEHGENAIEDTNSSLLFVDENTNRILERLSLLSRLFNDYSILSRRIR